MDKCWKWPTQNHLKGQTGDEAVLGRTGADDERWDTVMRVTRQNQTGDKTETQPAFFYSEPVDEIIKIHASFERTKKLKQ